MKKTKTLEKWAPGTAYLLEYDRSWLRGDVLAGITVAAYMIPQVMAYASVAGLPPVTGLWASLVPMLVYALLGSSRQLSVGCESTTALMTATALAPFALSGTAEYIEGAMMMAILVGVICLVAGFFRLGFLAELFSKPVLVGYMAGVAVIMIVGQLKKVTGVPVDGETIIQEIKSFFSNITQFHVPTLVLATAVLVLLMAIRKVAPKFPGPLLVVLAAAAAVVLFKLENHGIHVVGPIPAGLPTPTIPGIPLEQVVQMIIPAAGIAVVAFTDNTLTARTFAARKGEKIDANAELRALGVCNLATGVTRGFPVSSSGSRTALGDALGNRSQVYSLVMLATVVAFMFLGRGILESFPMAALGALVVYAAVRLVDIPEFRRVARFRRSELLLALATTVSVLVFGVLYGVMVAVLLSILDMLRRILRAHDSVVGYVPGMAGMHDINDYPNAQPVPGLVVYRYDAPLFFANAEDFRQSALNAVEQNATPVEWFVLNCEAHVDPDITAVDALQELHKELTGRGIVFALARVKQDLRDDLQAAGFLDTLGENRIFMTLPTAVEAFQARNTERPVTGQA
jgi:high affinity sulfate transporter 1